MVLPHTLSELGSIIIRRNLLRPNRSERRNSINTLDPASRSYTHLQFPTHLLGMLLSVCSSLPHQLHEDEEKFIRYPISSKVFRQEAASRVQKRTHSIYQFDTIEIRRGYVVATWTGSDHRGHCQSKTDIPYHLCCFILLSGSFPVATCFLRRRSTKHECQR